MKTAFWWPKNKPTYSPIGVDIGTRSVNMVQIKKDEAKGKLQAAAKRDLHEKETQDQDVMITILKEMKRTGRFVGDAAVSRMPQSQVLIIPLKLDAKPEDLDSAVIRAAGQRLTYPVEQAVIDYIWFDQKSPDRQRILLTAAKRSDVEQHLALLKKAGFHPLAVDVGPNALFRAFKFLQNAKSTRVMLINLGTVSSYFTILWDGHILIDRQAQWGHSRLVEKLVAALGVEPEEAWQMLCSYGINPHRTNFLFPNQDTEVLSEEEISGEIFEAIAMELEELIHEAERVMVYCASENQGDVMDQIYLLGSGPFIKNLDAFLKKKLGIEVHLMNPFTTFQGGERGHENPSLFGVATGLALWGFDPDGT